MVELERIMLVIRVELWPHGREEDRELLGIATVSNDGTGDKHTGNYTVALSKWEPHADQLWKSDYVKGFPRLKRGPWDLLYRALRACVGKRNPHPNE